MGIVFKFDEAFCCWLCDPRFLDHNHVIPNSRGRFSQYERFLEARLA